MTERWLPVPGWEGKYSVSDRGCVRSEIRVIERSDGQQRRVGGRLLKPFRSRTGYPLVMLAHNCKRQYIEVHRLVLAAFVGPLPKGMETLHWDDDRDNNNLPNLRYGTRSDNLRDMARNGRHFHANKTHCPRRHEYTPENTCIYQGRRNCRTCRRDRQRQARVVA